MRTDTRRPEDALQDFFRSYQTNEFGPKYRKRLAQLALNHGRSLVVDFEDLIAFDPGLAHNVVEHPDDFIGYASSAAIAQMRVEDPDYAAHTGRVFARFRLLPQKTPLRDLGIQHLGKLAYIDAVVINAAQVRPKIIQAVFRCRNCLEIIRVQQYGNDLIRPGPICPSCKQRGAFELLEEQSKFENIQEIVIQEHPANVLPRNIPRSFKVQLDEDLVDTANPGDAVTLTAILRIEGSKTSKLEFYLHANYVEPTLKQPAPTGTLSTVIDQAPIGDIISDYTLYQLKGLSPSTFQHWVIRTSLKGQPSAQLSGDLGIDGYTSDGTPIQVKQSEHVGRNTVDNFETAIRRRGTNKGIIAAFSFTQNALSEAQRARDDGLQIDLVKIIPRPTGLAATTDDKNAAPN